ncbi:MAG TPA: ATP-binding protein [Baekduia sp.]|nr:ATP-binding protein [Baekduia sp.]
MTQDVPGAEAQGSVDAFAALAAHQLGEAIALVRGATAILETDGGARGPHGDDALRALSAGAARAQRFVDDLLDLVRAGREPDDADGADLDAALDAAAARLAAPLERVTLQRDPLRRAGIEQSEAECLLGHVLRSALSAGAGRIRVGAEEEAGEVVLRVLDDGTPAAAGVDPLAPFSRPRGRGALVGAGVSLTVCRRIAERRGGTLTLVTGDDATTLVTARLPAAS